jgi:hypothetical protein
MKRIGRGFFAATKWSLDDNGYELVTNGNDFVTSSGTILLLVLV